MTLCRFRTKRRNYLEENIAARDCADPKELSQIEGCPKASLLDPRYAEQQMKALNH